MKDLEKLIEYYNKKVIMHEAHSEKHTEQIELHNYHLGIAEGYKKAAEELERVNRDITKKITDLI